MGSGRGVLGGGVQDGGGGGGGRGRGMLVWVGGGHAQVHTAESAAV